MADSALTEKPGLASLADQAGFAIIFNSGESIPAYAAMAMKAPRAMIGSGVIHGFSHDPGQLARQTADVQELSGGRFILGLGGGTKRMNINNLGREFDHPARRLRGRRKSASQEKSGPVRYGIAPNPAIWPRRRSCTAQQTPSPKRLHLGLVRGMFMARRCHHWLSIACS